jgi:hypothetical protein
LEKTDGNILFKGGEADRKDLFIPPTIIDVERSDLFMQDEVNTHSFYVSNHSKMVVMNSIFGTFLLWVLRLFCLDIWPNFTNPHRIGT